MWCRRRDGRAHRCTTHTDGTCTYPTDLVHHLLTRLQSDSSTLVSRYLLIWRCLLLQVKSSGVFELRLSAFTNDRGLNSDGDCCDGSSANGGACSAPCKTFFWICLKHYQAHISNDRKCTFGSLSTPIIGDNSFTFPDTVQRFSNPIKLPFTFSWPVSSYTPVIYLRFIFVGRSLYSESASNRGRD